MCKVKCVLRLFLKAITFSHRYVQLFFFRPVQKKMAYVAKGDKEFETATGSAAPKAHKIRITLTSKNVKNLEKG